PWVLAGRPSGARQRQRLDFAHRHSQWLRGGTGVGRGGTRAAATDRCSEQGEHQQSSQATHGKSSIHGLKRRKQVAGPARHRAGVTEGYWPSWLKSIISPSAMPAACCSAVQRGPEKVVPG